MKLISFPKAVWSARNPIFWLAGTNGLQHPRLASHNLTVQVGSELATWSSLHQLAATLVDTVASAIWFWVKYVESMAERSGDHYVSSIHDIIDPSYDDAHMLHIPVIWENYAHGPASFVGGHVINTSIFASLFRFLLFTCVSDLTCTNKPTAKKQGPGSSYKCKARK